MKKDIDWLPHDGWGDPKIPGDTRVEVMFRDGDTRTGVMHDWDQNWQWAGSEWGESSDGAIVSYRVIKKPSA